jgi:hypothetical protein
MKGPTETAQTPPRRTFSPNAGPAGAPGSGGAADGELLELPSGVDARTAELRVRIAAASRLPLVCSLLLSC